MRKENVLMCKNIKLILLSIIFSFLTFEIQADKIEEVDLEGFSIGKSLLEYASLDEINLSKASKQYPNEKYTIYKGEKIVNLKIYDLVNINIKKNDKKFIIRGIAGIKYYNTLDECNNLKREIQNSLEKTFKFDSKDITKFASNQDETGKSMVYGIQNYFKPYPSNEAIMVNCYHFTKESNIKRNLKVSVASEEFAYYIINEAFKK